MSNEIKECPYCGKSYSGVGFWGYCGKKCALEDRGPEWVKQCEIKGRKRLKRVIWITVIFFVFIIIATIASVGLDTIIADIFG